MQAKTIQLPINQIESDSSNLLEASKYKSHLFNTAQSSKHLYQISKECIIEIEQTSSEATVENQEKSE